MPVRNAANLILRPLFLLPCGLGMRLHHITKLHILVELPVVSRVGAVAFLYTKPVELINGLHLADLESGFTQCELGEVHPNCIAFSAVVPRGDHSSAHQLPCLIDMIGVR